MKYYDPVVEKNKTALNTMKVIFFIFLVIYFTSCANILLELGNQTREAGLIKAIEIELDSDPAAALVLFNALDTSISSKRENQVLLATIHAALCGQDFFDVTEGITATGDMMFKLMGVFSSSTAAEVTSCLAARDVIAGIDTTASNRNVNENILMAYISWSSIGSILSLTADSDDDDAVDGGFDVCNTGSITDSQVASVGVALNIMLDSLTEANGGSGTGGVEQGLLDALCSGGTPPAFCGITDQTTMEANAPAILEVRNIIMAAPSIGLGIVAAPCT